MKAVPKEVNEQRDEKSRLTESKSRQEEKKEQEEGHKTKR